MLKLSDTLKGIFSRDPPSIRYKTECYALYEAGFFGNKALTWASYKEIFESGWKGMVCMRSKRNIERRRVKYNIPLDRVPSEIRRWVEEGTPKNNIAFNQSMPDRSLLIQGEVCERGGDFYLTYTTIKKPMNLGLAEEEKVTSGLKAKIILQQTMSPSSYSDLEALLEIFPEAVIEFSTYSTPVGNINGRNTVIWEVRNY
jgi:hypothetical protein